MEANVRQFECREFGQFSNVIIKYVGTGFEGVRFGTEFKFFQMAECCKSREVMTHVLTEISVTAVAQDKGLEMVARGEMCPTGLLLRRNTFNHNLEDGIDRGRDRWIGRHLVAFEDVEFAEGL